MGKKLYKIIIFIFVTLFIAYLFYTKDIWRFYFGPVYLIWYVGPLILKFIIHLEQVGMSKSDYPKGYISKDFKPINSNQNNTSFFEEEKRKDISEYDFYEYITNPNTKEEYEHNDNLCRYLNMDSKQNIDNYN